MPAPSSKGAGTVLWGSLLLLACVLGFVFGGACVYFYLRDSDATTATGGESLQKNAESTEEDVAALGRIKPKDGILSLSVPVPDRIQRILVNEGEAVKKGDLLVILASEGMRNRDLELARIQRRQAANRLQAITANGEAQIRAERWRRDRTERLEPLEITALENKIAYLKAQKENAEKDRDRYVAAGDIIAKQNLEKQELALRQAETELIATESQLKKLRTSSRLDRRLADAQLEAMKAELKQNQSAISLDLLDTQIKQAEERLKETKIVAPSDGKILRLLAHEGELVQGKPIVQMANLDKMIVLAEVPVSFIPRIQKKDKATITSSSRAFEEQQGEVYAIGEIVGKPQVASLDPLASVDYRIVEVKILLKQSEPAARYIDHEVNVKIHPRKK